MHFYTNVLGTLHPVRVLACDQRVPHSPARRVRDGDDPEVPYPRGMRWNSFGLRDIGVEQPCTALRSTAEAFGGGRTMSATPREICGGSGREPVVCWHCESTGTVTLAAADTATE